MRWSIYCSFGLSSSEKPNRSVFQIAKNNFDSGSPLMSFSFLFGNLLGENSHQSYSCQLLRSAAAARCFHTSLITQAIVCSLSFTLAKDCLKAIWNKLESLSCRRDTMEDDPEFAVMALMSVYSQCIHYLHCRITFLTHSRCIHKC